MIQAGSSFDVFGEVVYLSTSTQLPKKKVEAIQPLQKKRFETCLNQLKCQQRRELMGELPDLKSCNIFGWCVRFGEVFYQKMHPEFCQVTRKFG